MNYMKGQWLLILIASFVLSACGGGGGSAAPAVQQEQSSTSTSSPSSTASTSTSTTSSSSDTTSSTSTGSSGSSSTDSSSSDTSSSDTSTDDSTFDIPNMLKDIADNVIMPNYADLATKTADFSKTGGSLANYCEAIGSATQASTRTTAQTEWKSVMAAIQRSETHPVGPASTNDDALRNRIYSYASQYLNTCELDQSVVLSEDSGFSLSARSSNQRGHGALEYLLFNDTLTHTCSSIFTSTQDWDGLSETDRESKRCNYAKKLATDISDASANVNNSWKADGSDYRADFISESNAGANIQAISDALIIMMDKQAKDRKLSYPTGIKQECSTISCAENTESKYSETSFENVKNNVQSFIDIYKGGTGSGFDDLITDAGNPADAGTNIEATSQAVITAITNNSATSIYDQASAITDATTDGACTEAYANPEPVTAAYSACSIAGLAKKVTDLLKIDFVTIVNVNLPGSVQSDND